MKELAKGARRCAPCHLKRSTSMRRTTLVGLLLIAPFFSRAESQAGEVLYIVSLRTGVHKATVVTPPGNGAFFEMQPLSDSQIICQPGDSGGAILDDDGRIIGVISGTKPSVGHSSKCHANTISFVS